MKTRLLLLMLLPAVAAQAQIWNGADTLYGNEWIDFSKTYFKIDVAADGVYRIPFQTLSNAGFPVGTIAADQFRLYHNGQQAPVFTSTQGVLGPLDYIEFFGERNRDALDRHLFETPDQDNLNPWYSLITDTAAYFLTWSSSGQPLRYTPVNNNLSNAPPRENFCWYTTGYFYTNALFKRQISNEVTYSWYNGEGFATYPSTDFSVNLSPNKLYAAGPDARLTVRFACDLGTHQQRLTFNDSLLAESAFANWGVREYQGAIPAASVKPNNLVRVQSVLGGADRNAVSGAFLRYPRGFDFDYAASAEFYLDAGNAPKYLEIQNFNAAGGPPIVYDLTNGLRLETILESGLIKAVLPASAQERRVWITGIASGIKTVSALREVHFRDYRPEPADYIILSNAALYSDPENNGANHVAEYADYRRSPAGGNHKVTVADVNEVYEQFAYGVRYHPLAIRNFLQYIEKQWPAPKYLLLIGKGLDYDKFRNPATQQALADSVFFVPTYGSPGADQLLVMREKKLSDPLLAIGRLAVVKPAEILNYLEKIKEHDQVHEAAPQTLEGKAWMKRVIHNSGGQSAESGAIRDYVQEMASELAGNRVGADIYTYYKTSDDPIQLSSYERILDLIDGGVSVWMIFGHSSPNAIDFDIGAPEVYHNKGRYPLMMIMGCFSGLCSAPQKGIGEQFVLAPDKGAIAYLASVNFSFIDALKTFGVRYYARMGGVDYGGTVGEIFQHTVTDLKQSNYSALVALLHQNLLQGDPAVKLHFYPGPDVVPDPGSVRFDPNPVGVEQPTLKLDVDVVNIGENTGGSLPLQISQKRPDNVVLPRVTDTIPVPAFRQKRSYDLSTKSSQVGFNRFLIDLDPYNTLNEQPAAAKFNNSLADASGQPGLDVYFFADDVAPVAPSNYGIVRKNEVTLQASTLNLAAAPMRYLFEFDTVERFDSPFKVTGQVNQRGGLLAWKPAVTLRDSTVYYWRVARDSLVNGQIAWRVRSFVCLPASAPGWNQSHFGQYRDGLFVNLQAVDSTRSLEFANNAGFISVTAAYRDINRYPGLQNAYYEGFFGDAGFNGLGVSRGVILMVQDPNTGHVWPNLPGSPYNASANPKPMFAFDTRDSLKRVALMDFIEHVIPKDYIVGLLALLPYNDTLGYAPRRWALDSVSYGKNLFSVLEAQGAKSVRSVLNYNQLPHPYALIFRKDNPQFGAIDTLVSNIDSAYNIRREFLAKWSVGQLETPPIGPARAWKSLHWQHGPFDDTSDQVRLSVLGLRDGLADTLLLSLENALDTALDFIPAAQFHQLKLRYESTDTLTRSATQPQALRVLYEPVPEGALDPVALFNFKSDTLRQGEPGRVSLAFANVSESAFDSLLVKFRVENDNSTGKDYFHNFRPLAPGDTLHTDFEINTLNINGKQRLLLDVNPNNAQPELYHFNNTAVQEFFVARDLRNPLLDVTFDGVHLLDGDIVSPKPVVIVTLKDDNPYLPISDTAAFSLKLVLPDGSTQALPLSSPDIRFFPADAGNLPQKNRARLEWRPAFTVDGEYHLLVNGRDASGNSAAALDYSISFRVFTHSSISNVLNYPNPFSSSTCFVYTMTGAEPPAHFRLRIMTVAGRVVREVTEAEFGPLTAGTHTSSFCWDGRDQYGDQLANGVYLYRVLAKKADGTDFEFFENTAVDGFFKNGFGKMVLMR